MNQPGLQVVSVFSLEVGAWIRHPASAVRQCRGGHALTPVQGHASFG
jgi:hypothetical protein